MTDLDAAAVTALRNLVAPDADFRAGQREAIEALVRDRKRVLVVQRTGWGKSAVYFIATRLLRDDGAGPTVLISPLLGLMRNQIEAAARGAVRAATINSDNQAEWDRVTDELLADQVDILLVSPERFANQKFRERVLPYIVQRAGLLVIDEAHCISDWGHDFRPDYRRLARVLDLLPGNVPVLCTTATANDRVVADIVDQLGHDLLVLRGSLDRESLALDVVHLPSQAQRMAWLAQVLPTIPGTGIVYTLTVADAQRVAEWLRQHGIDARAYFGAEGSDAKQQIEEDLKHNRLKCVVATSALGMGYDKPDLAFVVHFQTPGSAVAYYQQVGRAGRAVDRAVGIVLAGEEDVRIQDWFITTAFPSREHAEAVVTLLAERGDWVRLAELEEVVNLRRTRLTNMLKVLEVEGAIERNGNNSRRTLAPWTYPQARVAAVTEQRRAEQARMRDYLQSDRCLLQMLREELDDPGAAPCGRCGRCLGRQLFPVDLDTQLARDAVRFLRGRWVSIDPRKRWPDGTAIPAHLQAQPGRALAQYGDGGWGTMVKEQNARGAYSDELVTALVQLVQAWAPEPAPTWVTAVPSRRHPGLVPDLAARVAQRLEVPFVPALALVRDTATQKDMDNSSQQYSNVRDAFVVSSPVPTGPALLIDDLVDSRWTLTVVTGALRETGVEAVFPVVLAVAQSD
jgi:ATP-dependent DNA helicase RecQ